MKINKIIIECEQKLKQRFSKMEETALFNQAKILDVFKKNKIALRHFNGTTGYGYDDVGRDTLNKVYADVFGAESAIVSYNMTCGSHAIKIALYGILRPNDTLLSISGKPYDTLDETILGDGKTDNGSLKDFGIKYKQLELVDGKFDFSKIVEAAKQNPKLIYIQRSRGYSLRDALSIEEIQTVIAEIRKINKASYIMIDNCYCEFVQQLEPSQVGANIVVGSLIKNPGGGLVATGGYIAGDSNCIDLISTAFTSPSLKTEVGSYESGYRLLYQGLFLAPHIVLQALKGSLLIGAVMDKLGFKVLPNTDREVLDIVRSVEFKTKEQLISFCKGIQHASPVDSFVDPEPWAMPGYLDEVIMAAGTFVQGASIELSCDAPIREPYVLYIQGGLTYEHIKLALNEAIKSLL